MLSRWRIQQGFLQAGTCLQKPRQYHALMVLFAFLFIRGVGWGQTNEEVFREYQFDFSAPGSRAGGMGGAFIGLADDASASFANPAGLAYLSVPAITLEFRSFHRPHQSRTFNGNFDGILEQKAYSFQEASFGSANFRWHAWYIGFYRYTFLNERQTRAVQSRSISGGLLRIESREVHLDLEGETRGMGLARRFQSFKFGVSLNHVRLVGATSYQRETLTTNTSDLVEFHSEINDRNTAWGFNLGLLQEKSNRFSWGLVWREHPTLKLKENVFEALNQAPMLQDRIDVPFVTPDVLGLGGRFRLKPELSFLLDAQRVFYSQLVNDGFVIVESLLSESRENYSIPNRDELRAGLEWLLPRTNSIWALRVGYFHNPIHRVTYKGSNPAIRDRFQGQNSRSENHFTAGLGWAFRNRFELDLALNQSRADQEFRLSLIWRGK